MLRIILLATSLLIAGAACAGEAYEGKLLKREGLYYKPRSVKPFSGLHREWYVTGALIYETPYKKGRLHGNRRMWDPEGVLRMEQEWRDGKQRGMFRVLNEGGTDMRESCWTARGPTDVKLDGSCETD